MFSSEKSTTKLPVYACEKNRHFYGDCFLKFASVSYTFKFYTVFQTIFEVQCILIFQLIYGFMSTIDIISMKVTPNIKSEEEDSWKNKQDKLTRKRRILFRFTSLSSPVFQLGTAY